MNSSRSGFNLLKSKLGGKVALRRARQSFIRPASPAVPSVWPITALIDPTKSSPSESDCGKNALIRASAS